MQNMAWLIPHLYWRPTALLLYGTLLDRFPTQPRRCWTMQARTYTLCNAKVDIGNHGTLASTYKGLKKEFRSTNNVEHNVSFILMTSNVVSMTTGRSTYWSDLKFTSMSRLCTTQHPSDLLKKLSWYKYGIKHYDYDTDHTSPKVQFTIMDV